jgi:peptidoglycan hydrolase-like protein with peptidoglycan-binding domain
VSVGSRTVAAGLTAAAVAAALSLIPASAHAQTPTPTPTPTPPAATPTPTPTPIATATPTPTPTPVKATLTTSSNDVLSVSQARPIALIGRSFHVQVASKPYVAKQKVTVRVYRGDKKILVRALTLHKSGTSGVATITVKSAQAGALTITASHKRTSALNTLHAKTLRVDVESANLHDGSRGPLVRWLQGKLTALHYAVPTSGVFDGGTADAVMAFRKVAGMSRTYTASQDVFEAILDGRGIFKVRHPTDGKHIEARLGAQVLAEVDCANVVRIYHTSSGKPSTPTVRGRFSVYMKTPGTNDKGMVDSSYFIRGYAIHGYVSVPNYNASHGCLRVPIRDAAAIYSWLSIGDVVWVEE